MTFGTIFGFAYLPRDTQRNTRDSPLKTAGKDMASEHQVKTGELLRRLRDDGWRCVRQTGSHAIYRHPIKRGQLTVPVHPSKELPSGIAARLLKAAGLE